MFNHVSAIKKAILITAINTNGSFLLLEIVKECLWLMSTVLSFDAFKSCPLPMYWFHNLLLINLSLGVCIWWEKKVEPPSFLVALCVWILFWQKLTIRSFTSLYTGGEGNIVLGQEALSNLTLYCKVGTNVCKIVSSVTNIPFNWTL